MKPEILIPLLAIFLPLIGGGLGYWIKSILEKKRTLLEQVNIVRREQYQLFVNIMIDIFKAGKTEDKAKIDDYLSQIYEFYKKYILYASPKVIFAFSEYFQYTYFTNKNPEKNDYKVLFKKLTKIMKEMRSDLGLKNWKLGKNGEVLFRAIITDYDTFMKKKK